MARRPTKVERRQRILSAAQHVFTRRGYAATRMSDIAEAAQVGKGTLYEYFRSKEDLFATLVLVVMRNSLETLTAAGPAEDPERALHDTIAYVVETALGQNLDLYRLFFDYWGVAAAHRPLAQKRMREVATSFRAFLAETVRRGQRDGSFRKEVDPEQFAHALCAAVDGLSLQVIILGEKVDLKAYTRHLQQVFLGCVIAGGALGGASVLKERE